MCVTLLGRPYAKIRDRRCQYSWQFQKKKKVSQRGLGSHRPHGTRAGLRSSGTAVETWHSGNCKTCRPQMWFRVYRRFRWPHPIVAGKPEVNSDSRCQLVQMVAGIHKVELFWHVFGCVVPVILNNHSSTSLVSSSSVTQCHIPEYLYLQQHHCRNVNKWRYTCKTTVFTWT